MCGKRKGRVVTPSLPGLAVRRTAQLPLAYDPAIHLALKMLLKNALASLMDARIRSGHDETVLLEHDLYLVVALVGDPAHPVQFIGHDAELEALRHAGSRNHLQQRAFVRQPTDGAFDGRTPAVEGDLACLQHAAQQARLPLFRLP